jgi:glycosyltransferase involved in cell wall biosynthesis
MKVAHIVSTFPPYKAGVGNAAYHLSWELSQLGGDITVFTIAAKGYYDMDASLPFSVVRLRPWFWYGNAGFVPQLLWLLRDFDIIHLHYPFFGGAEMLYLRDLVKPLNIIIHYHMDVVGDGVMKRLFAFHSAYVLPRILGRANKIIVTSMDYAKRSLLKDRLLSESDKFIEIPLGVDPEVFKPRMKPKDLVLQYKLQNKKIVLFVGALDRAHYFKGVNYLIKAFQLISSNDAYRLVIVGGGNLKATYESLAINYGLERKVIFTGIVSDDALPLYYNLADVFVVSSIDSSEAFGIVALEAMATGLPVVASDLPGVRSVVQKGLTGLLFKPKDVTFLAKQLHYLLENPQVCNKLGKLGRERVQRYYTWHVVGKEVYDMYQQHSL